MIYAKINEEGTEFDLVRTRTEISDEALVKNGLIKIIDEGAPDIREYQKIKKELNLVDKVKVVAKYTITDKSLDLFKTQKIFRLKQYISGKFPPMFKQVNALLGEYDEVKSSEIKQQIEDWRAYIDSFELLINDANTYEEVEKIDFTPEEDKEVIK